MGRVRGKGKRQPIVSVCDDNGSGEDDKLSPVKQRGRPQTTLKNDMEEVYEVVKIDDSNDFKDKKSSGSSKVTKQNGRKRKRKRKRKRPSPEKENPDLVKEESGGAETETRTNATDLIKNNGYRQNGSRRKNKPRRAAEVGVECN